MPPQDVGMNQPAAGMIPSFKGQPWILFDTIASSNFTVGQGTALGSNAPAIGQDGSMVFFQERTRAKWPNLTNLDNIGQLSYGFKCHAIAFEILFPAMPPIQGIAAEIGSAGVPPTERLAEAIMGFGVVEVNLGQENQSAWPITSFGNGGSLWQNSSIVGSQQNGAPDINNVMMLPEPIDMGRTQNFDIKIKVAQFMFATIGTSTSGAGSGVGQPLAPYIFTISEGSPDVTVSVAQAPYAIKCKLIGERIKLTQYGAPNT